MKRHCWGVALLLVLIWSRPAISQEIDDGDAGGAYGYTSIDYDADSGQVTAYSETDIDPDLEIYYAPTLGFAVYDQDNNFITGSWQNGCTKYFDGGTFSWSCQFAATPSNTYTAYGDHGAELLQQYSCTDDCYDSYIDYVNFFELEDLGFFDLGAIDFFGPGPTVQGTQNASVGTTYDSAAITIPGCGDIRDQMIKEYFQYSSYKPQCVDFVDPTTWNYYFYQLTNSYFSFADLTTDQTTGAGSYAALQPYAYVNGLNSIGNQVVAVSAPYGLTSAYRNPLAEIAVANANGSMPAPNSRHQSGDGADLKTNWSGVNIFDTINGAAAAANTGACFEDPDQEHRSHVHVDWRSQTGPTNNWGGTNDWPNPTARNQPAGCPATWEYH